MDLYRPAAFVVYIVLFWTFPALAGESNRVIIFPLDADTGEETLAWLSEGIAFSLGEQLKSRNVIVISRNERNQLVESADLPPGGRLSRASMIGVAQKAEADLLVMGKFSGSERNLKVVLRVLDIKTLKLSGEIAANGPVSAIPQMENELAWLILSNVGLESGGTRESFQQRMRKVPNSSYSSFIQSLGASNQNAQIQLLKKAVTGYRDFPEAQFRLGRLFFIQKDCNSAMPHLNFGRIEAEESLENEFMKGTCSGLKDQYEQAIQSLSYVLSISRSFEALNNLGIAYLRKGDTGQALSALLEARSLEPKDSTVLMNLIIVQLVQGSFSSARSLAEEAIRAHPKNGMLHFLLSFLLKKQGENEQALAAGNKANGMGINVDKLLTGDPKDWARMLFGWNH